jgi:cell division protein FtsW
MMIMVLMLTSLGLVMISSTSAPFADSSSQLKRQLIWFVAGLISFGVVGWVDYRVWRPWAWVLFGSSLLLLALVFVPGIGSRVKGASRWLNLFGFKIQPSEFLRLSVVMMLAHGLAKHQAKIREWKWGFIWPLCILVIPLVMLRMEPDLGTMLLLILTTLIMMYISGARVWPILGAGTVGMTSFVMMMWMLPERRARVLAFLNPEEHKDGKFFQIWQGILAFGSGGLQGLGLGNSRQKAGFVPESTTDSIFPIIGEELGFYITAAVVIAYIVILLCAIWISMNSQDAFGMLLGFGLIFGLTLQALINIGTVTGSIPPKGMPLPFVSYGGSNLMISYIVIGFLLSIQRQTLRSKRYSGGMSIDDETPHI